MALNQKDTKEPELFGILVLGILCVYLGRLGARAFGLCTCICTHAYMRRGLQKVKAECEKNTTYRLDKSFCHTCVTDRKQIQSNSHKVKHLLVAVLILNSDLSSSPNHFNFLRLNPS